MLKLEQITVCYGSRRVVDQVSMTLEEGQWLMLCGPNGAGKSTLVRAIAQGVRYDGRILLHGQDIRACKPAYLARQIGVLSQSNSVEYGFTVEEVVALGRYAHSRSIWERSDPQGAALIDAALDATGLTAMRRQSMLSLSGGEMQRAFLAQVFAQNPSLLILDEPANHLDLMYQKQLFSLIGDWLQTPGRAVISVVHDLSLAMRYGTHALLMNDDRAVSQGEAKAVLNRDALCEVYGMDVYGWMQEMLGQWTTDHTGIA